MERETPTVPETSTQIDLKLAAIGVVSGVIAAMAMDAVTRFLGSLNGDARAASPTPAGLVSRYGLGAAMGVNYMLASEQAPDLRRGYGTVYGSLVWAAADEGALPAAGLARKPTDVPLGVHASTLGAHWVYGATLETCRRVAAAILDAWERSGNVVDVVAEPVPPTTVAGAAGTA